MFNFFSFIRREQHVEEDATHCTLMQRQVMGRGRGVVATRNLRAGEFIVVERPLLHRYNMPFQNVDVVKIHTYS